MGSDSIPNRWTDARFTFASQERCTAYRYLVSCVAEKQIRARSRTRLNDVVQSRRATVRCPNGMAGLRLSYRRVGVQFGHSRFFLAGSTATLCRRLDTQGWKARSCGLVAS